MTIFLKREESQQIEFFWSGSTCGMQEDTRADTIGCPWCDSFPGKGQAKPRPQSAVRRVSPGSRGAANLLVLRYVQDILAVLYHWWTFVMGTTSGHRSSLVRHWHAAIEIGNINKFRCNCDHRISVVVKPRSDSELEKTKMVMRTESSMASPSSYTNVKAAKQWEEVEVKIWIWWFFITFSFHPVHFSPRLPA